MTQEPEDLIKKRRRQTHKEHRKAKRKASRLTQEEPARKAPQTAAAPQ